MSRSPHPTASLKAQAIVLLSQREHSRNELRRKLMQRASAAHTQACLEASARDAQREEVQSDVTDNGNDVVQHRRVAKTVAPSALVQYAFDAQPETAPPRTASHVDLRGHKPDPEQVSEIARQVEELLDWLTTHAYLSEERFVESRIHARAARYGNQRIKQELSQHGLVMSEETRQSLRDTELERARAVWRRKFGNCPQDGAERARQTRFLAARGFTADTIRQVLRGDPE